MNKCISAQFSLKKAPKEGDYIEGPVFRAPLPLIPLKSF